MAVLSLAELFNCMQPIGIIIKALSGGAICSKALIVFY